MRRMPIRSRIAPLTRDGCPPRVLRGIRRSFLRLSPCCGQVAYVLLTRAPVAARRIATPALPLDLHVLSLSLAFILSQDQTLRCCISFLFLLLCKERRLLCLHRETPTYARGCPWSPVGFLALTCIPESTKGRFIDSCTTSCLL